jgi:phosphoribosyl-ATP pyrophosphohydrolase/phosphoribosyl-AMP cyclohydrolase
MIIPSIDLQGGRTVQLEQGEALRIDAGDPLPIVDRFAVAGPVAVIDLDAAKGEGDNRALITSLLPRARCRVGGGIRDVETARRWLDAGAEQVIIGTAATPALLQQLPKERVIAALDARDGDVVVEGWRRRTGQSVEERIEALRPFVGGFLLTFVEREGRLEGTDLERARRYVALAGETRVTIAGGVTTAEEIRALDAIGADAQVGMALYEGRLSLGDAVTAPLPPDTLWPTVVVDESQRALGLVYSNAESVRVAVEERRGVYWSRKRGLWRKGETSGATQALVRVELDCDRDALRFVVRQRGTGFCHLGTVDCFGGARGMAKLERTVAARAAKAPPGSYTRRLLDDGGLLGAKLREEADELARASTSSEVRHEAADVLYFLATKLQAAGVSFADVERELDLRALKVSRRPGDDKPGYRRAS